MAMVTAVHARDKARARMLVSSGRVSNITAPTWTVDASTQKKGLAFMITKLDKEGRSLEYFRVELSPDEAADIRDVLGNPE